MSLIEVVYSLIVVGVFSFLMVDIFSNTYRLERSIKEDVSVVSNVNSCLEDELNSLGDDMGIYDHYTFTDGVYERNYGDSGEGINLLVKETSNSVGNSQLIEVACTHVKSGVSQSVKKYIK